MTEVPGLAVLTVPLLGRADLERLRLIEERSKEKGMFARMARRPTAPGFSRPAFSRHGSAAEPQRPHANLLHTPVCSARRQVGSHRKGSLFNARLPQGTLMFWSRFRNDPSRFFPPHGKREKGIKVMDILQFFVLFPLSANASRALYGWARGLSGRQLALRAPLLAALALLQAASFLLGCLTMVMFCLFGTLYCVARHGDTKITLARGSLAPAPLDPQRRLPPPPGGRRVAATPLGPTPHQPPATRPPPTRHPPATRTYTRLPTRSGGSRTSRSSSSRGSTCGTSSETRPPRSSPSSGRR